MNKVEKYIKAWNHYKKSCKEKGEPFKMTLSDYIERTPEEVVDETIKKHNL